MKAILLLTCYTLLNSLSTVAQEKCGTMMLPQNLTYHGSQADQFENWIAQKRLERQQQRSGLRSTEEEFTIPVVVHVIHKGESIGNGTNIPVGQILSQIEVLNEDYRRNNADGADTPAEFLPAAADALINFQLAVRDPEGLPTDGIVRVQGARPTYSLSGGQLLSDISYWPSEDYLNIWVTDLSSGLLGFAQFPVSNLEGMDVDRVSNPLTDGVVIDYEYFGKGFNADDFSQGRTVTHEVGHYLGLRHIWGDGGCSVDDFCTDTPVQERSTSGCPDSPTESCGSIDMSQNFMDYTDDICMNLFTHDQRERMHIILANSPRRASLKNSLGLVPPENLNNDLGIRQWLAIYNSSCADALSPVVELRNYGNDAVQSFALQLFINDLLIEELTITDANITFRELTSVQFSDAVLPDVGVFELEARIKTVNGVQDDQPDNDMILQQLAHTQPVTGDYFTDFESPHEWQLQTGSALSLANAPNLTATNTAAVFDFYASPLALGTTSKLESPIIKLNPSANPRLEFSYAYNHPPSNLAEAMFVVVSTDCGVTYLPENTVFQSYGNGLNSSNQPAELPFVPTGPTEWKTASVNLSRFLDANFIRVAFIGQNGHGNRLYIDDIVISAGPNADYDLSIEEVSNFPLVTCTSDISQRVTISNNGNKTINAFQLTYDINGEVSGATDYQNVDLDPFDRTTVTLELENLPEGTLSEIRVAVQLLDTVDQLPDNDEQVTYAYFDQTEVQFPYRLDLNEPDWFNYGLNGQSGWEFTSDHAQVTLSSGTVSGEAFWLVSPVIYPGQLNGLSMAFEVAYPHMTGKNDGLIVAIDRNCDGIFEQELINRSGAQLATADHVAGWEPGADDWRREFVDLSNFLIFDEVRLAFKAISQQGTSIYLRDIEFFATNRPSIGITNQLRVYPNPATDLILVKFNLDQIAPATMRLVDMNGKVIFEKTYANTLNQTYELYTANENNGMYLLQIITPGFKSTQRVIIWH